MVRVLFLGNFLFVILPLIWSKTKLSEFMMALDKNISEILLNPAIDQGEPLLYNLDEYITRVRDVNHLLKFSPKFMYQTAKTLQEENAPQFLHAGVDLQHLHDIFQWEDFKTEAIGQYLTDIKNYTKTFKILFKGLSADEFDKYDYESHEW